MACVIYHNKIKKSTFIQEMKEQNIIDTDNFINSWSKILIKPSKEAIKSFFESNIFNSIFIIAYGKFEDIKPYLENKAKPNVKSNEDKKTATID